jgi:acyl-CoA synthetase (AMP-forming)/AMP-acid ligase II
MLLEMAADGFGERVAVGTGTDGLTFSDLRRQATAVAARLQPSRPTVALLAETSPLVPVALFAAAWTGVPYAPLNYRLPAEAREALLARRGLTATVAGDRVHVDLAEVSAISGTNGLTGSLGEINRAAMAEQLTLVELTVSRASLEDRYLSLTAEPTTEGAQ